MAQVIQRIWRSGPRKVKKVAWGYTLQIHGKQERKYDATWSKEDARDALAARILNRDATPPSAPAPGVTLAAMIELYLRQKAAGGKKTIQNDREALARCLAFFGPDTP